LTKARRHLARRDPVLKRLIAAIGPCTMRHDPDGFAVLVRSIISQQISWKAAASIGAKLRQALGPRGLTPEGVLATSGAALRGAGLSAAKASALIDLASRARDGTVAFDRLPALADEEVIEHLVPVRGIGRWTAEMFLIFCLGRLDILPVADLGLRVGIQRQYLLEKQPDKKELHKLAEPWRPYRSVATWYFWRSFGPVPQS
jgi:DNA-3-methyladenine glycosylase II